MRSCGGRPNSPPRTSTVFRSGQCIRSRTRRRSAEPSRGRYLPGHRTRSTSIERLATDAEAGVVASQGPRYFGFVTGASLPAALAADWLTSTWDQNLAFAVMSPAAAVIEETAGRWVAELLALPASASFAFTTGCQMAHVTCLAAARHHILAEVGWDVAERGLSGAPEIRVVAGEQRHATLDRALRLLGIGRARSSRSPPTTRGACVPHALRGVLDLRSRP